MTRYQIAQVNIGRIRAALGDPAMAGFVNRLEEINSLADSSPGFVWRLIVNDGNATYLRPFEDPHILLNMSVWETIDELRQFVYHTAHKELLQQRHAWFEKLGQVYTALWWVPQGHIPSVGEAIGRLAHLQAEGPTQLAFTFQTVIQPDDDFQRRINWRSFDPCPAI